MSIGSANNRNDYTGTGSLDTYAFTFKIYSQADLVVTKTELSTGIEVTLALTTDYTVDGVNEEAGGEIVLVAGNLPATHKITIRRVLGLLQSADFKNQTTFYPISHEQAFDRLVMMIQDLQEQVSRCVKLPIHVTGVDPTMPEPVAGESAKWNGTADALEAFVP